MKLTPEQEMRLHNVTKADLEWRTAKVEMAAIARRYAEEQMGHISYERDRAVRLAIEAGVPKTQVGKVGLSTTDPGTVLKILKRTEGSVAQVIAAEETDPLASTYSLTADGNLRVTLDAERMTEAKALAQFNDSLATAPEYADFTTRINRGVTQLDAISPRSLENYEKNPIVKWAFKHEAEALAWFAQHTETEAGA